MDIIDFMHKENSFLDSWARQVPGFIRDGVVDAEEYFNCKYKILVLLKEANGGADWDMREYLRGNTYGYSTGNVARWTEGILNIEKDIRWEYLAPNDLDKRKVMLRKIAWINIKKVSGGAVANDKEIEASAINNSKLLREQVDMCEPDIIICCGTSPYYVKYIGHNTNIHWKTTTRGISYLLDGKRIVIDFYHPQSKIAGHFLHYSLIDAVREVLQLQAGTEKY